MSRTMGDAIHANVASLPAGLELVAGYVTGTPDIQWTSADWDRFPGIPHVTIDQGANGSPVPAATVRDVETGAWTPVAAVNQAPWTPARPTIYCNQSTLPAVLAAGWRGDLWLAIDGWQPGDALPNLGGCTLVAVQNTFAANYDLSVVLDPSWPAADQQGTSVIEIPGVPGQWLEFQTFYVQALKQVTVVGLGTDGRVWWTRSVNGGPWSVPAVL